MNWISIIIQVLVAGAFLLVFGQPILDFLSNFSFNTFFDGVDAIAEILEVFIVTLDNATALFPLTIQTIVILAGVGIAMMVLDSFISRGSKK
jgi:hypothetical protein